MKQFCWTISALFAFALIVVIAQPANATTAIMLSDSELIVHSRVIVSGSVRSVMSNSDSSGMVWTYVEVHADRVLKGDLPEETIVLKQMGGTLGESGVRIVGQAEFTRGERILLYLNTGVDGTLHAAHGFMGKFSVVEDSSGVEFVERSNHANEVEFLARTSPGEVTNRARLDSYISKIKRTLRRESALIAEIDAARSGELLVAVPHEFSRSKKQPGGFSPEFTFFAGQVRWMEADAGQPIRYFLNPNGPVSGGGSTEIGRAMAAWTNQSGASITLQVAGQTNSCGITFDNQNTISFGDCLNQLDPPIGCAGVVALTAISYIQEQRVIGGITFNKLLEADTVFNDGMNCFLSNSANLAEVACHELGHSIGLGHSADLAALMWPTAHGGGRDANLGTDDKNGILAMYPSSSGGGGGPGPVPVVPVSISTFNVNDAVVGRFYSLTLTATGGTQPYRWSVIGGSLPSGLSLSVNGTIEGVPNFVGSSAFVAQVIDSGNPLRFDSKWFSITVRENIGSPPGFPNITRVKLKGSKKLWVFGENFRAGARIVINGRLFEPVQFVQEGSQFQLLAKGKLNLGAQGTNVVVVSNTDNSSVPFIF